MNKPENRYDNDGWLCQKVSRLDNNCGLRRKGLSAGVAPPPRVMAPPALVMTVPERFARRHGLHSVQLPVNDVPALETHLYWHESTDQDPANRWMREQIIEICQQVTAQEKKLDNEAKALS